MGGKNVKKEAYVSNHDVVLCRSFGNEPLVRTVLSITKEGILICGQESFDTSERTQDDIVPVLAPFDAIYDYDEDLFRQLDKAFQNSGDGGTELEQLWRQAKPYVVIVGKES